MQNFRHEPPQVVQEVERKIRQLLPLVVMGCHGGSVWITGLRPQGARIAKWEGDKNAVSKVFLARNCWEARHGRIDLMVCLDKDVKEMEFIAVENCGAELLLGPDKDAFRVFKGVSWPMTPPSTPDPPLVGHPQASHVADDSPTPRQAIRTEDPLSRSRPFGWQPVDTETKIVISQSSTPQSILSENALRNKQPPNEDPSAKESTDRTQRKLMLAGGCFVGILMGLAPVFALCVLKLPEVIRALSQFDVPVRIVILVEYGRIREAG
ncbi:hypothetical protein BDZ45DRAFT_676343 [Acephala macrosclerotiorum]|nr:hypothetical protein BDZ45DRAFT_676343 [Acephala macrosclerotiorum]